MLTTMRSPSDEPKAMDKGATSPGPIRRWTLLRKAWRWRKRRIRGWRRRRPSGFWSPGEEGGYLYVDTLAEMMAKWPGDVTSG